MNVPAGGYRWWYLDALSDDGRHGLTVIAFVGSVFSPYYWWAGRRAPEDHVAINVCLYGPDRHHWAMTERGRGALSRDGTTFRVGPSGLTWEDGRLTVAFDERSSPFPRVVPYPMRGRIVLHPEAMTRESFGLGGRGRHGWWPIAPFGRVEVRVEEPALGWDGHGYLDTNWGSEMLEEGFRRWDWSRARLKRGAAVLYDMEPAGGGEESLALLIREDGRIEPFEPPARQALPRGWWGVRRQVQADAPGARILRGFEDSPFYTRSAISTNLMGERAEAVHETLDCRRFASPVVKAMLPMRMPRRSR